MKIALNSPIILQYDHRIMVLADYSSQFELYSYCLPFCCYAFLGDNIPLYVVSCDVFELSQVGVVVCRFPDPFSSPS